MKAWKPWQIVFLVYLLTLNLVVFGILGFYLLNKFFSSTPSVSGTVVAGLVDTLTATIPLTFTPIPEPIELTVPTLAVEEKILEDSDRRSDYIPPVNIPPFRSKSRIVAGA